MLNSTFKMCCLTFSWAFASPFDGKFTVQRMLEFDREHFHIQFNQTMNSKQNEIIYWLFTFIKKQFSLLQCHTGEIWLQIAVDFSL